MCSGGPIDPATALAAGAWSKIWRTVPPGRGSIAAPAMLARARRRAARHPGADIQLVEGDMYRLPLEDSAADLCLSYGGLHRLSRPQDALSEMARCLRHGGRLLGSTFLSEGSRRQRLLLRNEDFGSAGSADDLREWLHGAGFSEGSADRSDGLVVFSALRP